MAKKKSQEELDKLPKITKTCKVILAANDGSRYPAGEFTLTAPEPGPTVDQFADAAFKFARSSLARLMTPQYRLIVIDGEMEAAYGLSRWIKLIDTKEQYEARLEGKGKKQTVRKTAKA